MDNMDINNVSFTNLKKFDGKKTRKLNLSEISQIAGRAGRHVNDGTFGTTGECKQLSADEIDKLEKHQLNKIDVLCWRNSEINFDSLENLTSSENQLLFTFSYLKTGVFFLKSSLKSSIKSFGVLLEVAILNLILGC